VGRGGIHCRKGVKRVDQAPPERHACRKAKRKTKNEKEKGSPSLTRGGNYNDIATWFDYCT